jgi:hypothetical protein
MQTLQKTAEPVMDKWEFLQRHDGAWYWQHTNAAGAVRTSAACFDSESDCVGNAIYNGYLPRPSVASRPRLAISL